MIEFRHSQYVARFYVAQIYLYQNLLIKAKTAIEEAAQYSKADGSQREDMVLGIISYRMGDRIKQFQLLRKQ